MSRVNYDTVILGVDFAAVGFLMVEFIPGIHSTVLRGGVDSCVYFYSAQERCLSNFCDFLETSMRQTCVHQIFTYIPYLILSHVVVCTNYINGCMYVASRVFC